MTEPKSEKECRVKKEDVMSDEQTGHTMRVVLDNEYVRLKLVCHEKSDALCHESCPHGCEELCDHETVSSCECNAVVWMENSDIECLCDVDGEVSLHDGMPVVVEWDGDNWNWIPVSMCVERNPS